MNFPDFSIEEKHWKNGINVVLGADEVGRGCFAGPVVAACVSFSPNTIIPDPIYINDSKKVSSKKREEANSWIIENCLVWGVGEVPVDVINDNGITMATNTAFGKSVDSATKKLSKSSNNNNNSYLLIDAFYIPNVDNFGKDKQQAVQKGDENSISIAAASIVAKVYRDNLMIELSKHPKYLIYGWDKNKGYGTAQHRDAIVKHGTTKHHRKQFVQTFLSKYNQ